ncbi:hypothetical protein TD95_004775 [Thielaviopsis punctulata]|uniref:GH16 domain-containing protein n=1 Tax=Thielaviopsis punctulata TaxID=72032 RepID=A0A0F4ZD20_9PEZI|nr:hypothetical protein TD95_004775 [Thielaviopsis punctulata]
MHSLNILTPLAILATLSFAAPYPAPDTVPRSPSSSFASDEAKDLYRGWNIAFYDDFNTTSSSPDPDKWVFSTGTSYPGGPANWGNGEVQEYTSSPSNVYISRHNKKTMQVDNSASLSSSISFLNIVPERSSSASDMSTASAGSWTSARLETNPSYSFTCPPSGQLRMEACFRLGDASANTQLGIWPAFWALGTAFRGNYTNWPAVGEIDIFEAVNGHATSMHTVHCGTNPGGPCNEPNGLSKHVDNGALRNSWLVVSVTIDRSRSGGWQNEALVWRINGTEVYSLTGGDVGDMAAWAALAHSDHFLLLNVAVGGALPNALAATQTPVAATEGGPGSGMQVSYVGVFTRDS